MEIPFSPIPTGVSLDYWGTSAPTGYVLLSGRTIGSAGSSATERANVDTLALYTLLWNSLADSEAPVSSGRGVSAAADFAVNKTLTLPDARGRVIAGKDNMGGSDAARLSTITATTLGKSGGSQTHVLIEDELATHIHSGSGLSTSSSGAHTHSTPSKTTAGTGGSTFYLLTSATTTILSGGISSTVVTNSSGDHTHTITGSTASSGLSTAHNNTQPTLVANKIIKL